MALHSSIMVARATQIRNDFSVSKAVAKMTFEVSVVTPVYNAEKYLRQSVESAAILTEVREILLVNDFGPDKSWDVAIGLSKEIPKIRLLAHADSKNHGAGASRNLGIKEATFPYIAFLDADDWYLPNRFEAEKTIFINDRSIDGVYNALSNHYQSEEMRALWLSQNRPELMTLSGKVAPEELSLVLWHCHPTVKGEFSTDTITVKKTFFDRVGYFNTELRLQQDTHMWKRMSVAGRLAGGNLQTPTAIRRVHPQNRMTHTKDHDQYMDLWHSSLYRELRLHKAPPEIITAWHRSKLNHKIRKGNRLELIHAFAAWIQREPCSILEPYGYFDTFLRSATSNHWLTNRFLSAKNRGMAFITGTNKTTPIRR
jgi:glycosyltransferase involved in cell wall biosynthesis